MNTSNGIHGPLRPGGSGFGPRRVRVLVCWTCDRRYSVGDGKAALDAAYGAGCGYCDERSLFPDGTVVVSRPEAT